MTYIEFIQHIIDTRGQWNPPSKYWEGHHIIPRCLGGEGRNRTQHDNIIWLTLEEHKIAHELLFNDYPQLREQWKHNISKNHADISGENNPMFGKGYLVSGERNGMFGKKQSEHQRYLDSVHKIQWHKDHPGEAISKIKMWRKNNPELYSKAQSRPGGKNGRSMRVRCIETNKVFDCVKFARLWLDKNKLDSGVKNISKCCKGECLTAGGYHWAYEDI